MHDIGPKVSSVAAIRIAQLVGAVTLVATVTKFLRTPFHYEEKVDPGSLPAEAEVFIAETGINCQSA